MGLRPISTILDQSGVPHKIVIPNPGDRAMATYTDSEISTTNASDVITNPNTRLDIISNNNITTPNIILDTVSTTLITTPDIKLDAIENKLLTIPETNVNNRTTKIIDPHTDITIPASTGVDIPMFDVSHITSSFITIPDIKLDRPRVDNITLPSVDINHKHSEIAIPEINIIRGKSNVTINPDTVLNTSSVLKITNPDIAISDTPHIAILPNILLDSTELKLVTDPSTQLETPTSDTITIPDIRLDAQQSTLTIPDVALDSLATTNITDPNIDTILSKLTNNISVPNIDILPTDSQITIPDIALGTITSNLVTPNIQLTSPIATIAIHSVDINTAWGKPSLSISTNFPVLDNITLNPNTTTDLDIVSKAYTSGYTPQRGVIPIGDSHHATSYPGNLNQPVPFTFDKNFNTAASVLSKYTSDKIGKTLDALYNTGSSDAPYVTRRIGQTWGPSTPGLGIVTAINRALWDVVRFSKWAGTNANGALFLARQAGLQLSNPKLETTTAQSVFLPLMPTRIYNPLTLAAQLLGAPIGVHLPRHGLLPISRTYEQVNAANNTADNYIAKNRLINMYEQLEQHASIFTRGVDEIVGGWIHKPVDLALSNIEQPANVSTPGRLSISEFNQVKNMFGVGGAVINAISGLAGPNSLYGIGATIHRTATHNSRLNFKWMSKNGLIDVKSNYRPIGSSTTGTAASTTSVGDMVIVDGGTYSDVVQSNKFGKYKGSFIVGLLSNDHMIYISGTDELAKIKSGGMSGDIHPKLFSDIAVHTENLFLYSNSVKRGFYNSESTYIQQINNTSAITSGTPIEHSKMIFNYITRINEYTSNYNEIWKPGLTETSSVTGITTTIKTVFDQYNKLLEKTYSDTFDSEQITHGSPEYKRFTHTATEVNDDNFGSTANDTIRFTRNSYPAESKRGDGAVRRTADDSSAEGSRGSWPDMYARVGVQNTGIGQYDKLMANEKPSSFGDLGRDFVTVRIKRDGGAAISFRAYLIGVSDKHTPSTTGTKYIGRPDEVITYTGYSRSIGFSLMIVAESHTMLHQVYDRLNKLASFSMPVFNSAGIMTGPLVYVTIGHLFRSLPAYITGIDYDFADDYPWDIEEELPMYVKVGMGFDIIGHHIPDGNKLDYYSMPMWSKKAFDKIAQGNK